MWHVRKDRRNWVKFRKEMFRNTMDKWIMSLKEIKELFFIPLQGTKAGTAGMSLKVRLRWPITES